MICQFLPDYTPATYQKTAIINIFKAKHILIMVDSAHYLNLWITVNKHDFSGLSGNFKYTNLCLYFIWVLNIFQHNDNQ